MSFSFKNLHICVAFTRKAENFIWHWAAKRFSLNQQKNMYKKYIFSFSYFSHFIYFQSLMLIEKFTYLRINIFASIVFPQCPKISSSTANTPNHGWYTIFLSIVQTKDSIEWSTSIYSQKHFGSLFSLLFRWQVN